MSEEKDSVKGDLSATTEPGESQDESDDDSSKVKPQSSRGLTAEETEEMERTAGATDGEGDTETTAPRKKTL
jgi:hypothetical protein